MTSVCRTLIFVFLIAAGAGCASRVDLEKVPIGTRVEVTRQDGGVIRGTLTALDDRNVRMAVGSVTRSIPRDQITHVQVVDDAASTPVPLSAAARFREFTLRAGTVLVARLDSSLGSDSSRVDDPVEATLTEAALVDGVEVLPAGSVVNGVVTTADRSGKVSGRASLAVRFRSVSLAGRNETYALSASVHHTAASTKGDDAKKIGIPAAGGAIIGALLGGKKGAGIGAIIGGGGGAAVVLTTSGPEVRYARGTVLSLPLDQAIDVRVPIKR
jgi:hypothetical protein